MCALLGPDMCSFLRIAALMLFAGGLGGLAGSLLQPPDKGEWSLSGAVRLGAAGAIVALAVPLFLSVVQSSLIATIVEKGEHRIANALVLVGFCVAAGFASRGFMDTIATQMMHVMQIARRAEERSEKAEETSEVAVDLAEEGIDKTHPAEEAVREAPLVTAETEHLAKSLDPEDVAVLQAALHKSRTFTGLSRDAGVPRKTVKKSIVPKLVGNRLLRFTTSANTGVIRVGITPLGAGVLSSPVLKSLAPVPSRASDANTAAPIEEPPTKHEG